MQEVKSPVMLYTEQTPNPESLKFVTNRMLYEGTADFRTVEEATEWSPLATELFEYPYVKGVYISTNFVTITKEFNYEWANIMLKLKEAIKQKIENQVVVLKEGFEAVAKEKAEKSLLEDYNEDDKEAVIKIIELIDTYVKPAVEMDGGNIEFKSYKDGVVTVIMQGSCSGCPSSTVTLKSGIEGMLQRMIPEIKEVRQEMM